MHSDIGPRAVQILEPYIGGTIADTCVRAKAISLGKTMDTLAPEDIPAIEDSVRRFLGPVASMAAIDLIVEDLRRLAR